MPVKRRIAKGRHALDEHHMEDLFYGPDTCLFGGCGYCGDFDTHWKNFAPEQQESVIAAMRADWERHSATVLAAWDARTAHQRQIAREYHGNPVDPWALREFGEP